MLHEEEWFPEAADFKGLVKSHVVCHAGMHWGGTGVEGCREVEEGRMGRLEGGRRSETGS